MLNNSKLVLEQVERVIRKFEISKQAGAYSKYTNLSPHHMLKFYTSTPARHPAEKNQQMRFQHLRGEETHLGNRLYNICVLLIKDGV
ncbi:hypothetical protein M8J75_003137 [Diaphorina citri]|nr:hypothetical protein M8J75_003137 [Diaphorina citri]